MSKPEPEIPPHPVVLDELDLLARVHQHLATIVPEAPETPRVGLKFDDDLVELRDEVAEAKLEDVAPLAEQMMRVAAIRAARGQGLARLPVDPRCPYFGHLRLAEEGRVRDVCIGKWSYVNATAGVVIVDWRNAPISRLYYRYDEGDDYDEPIAGKTREGIIEARRTLSVIDGELRRVSAPQGVFVRDPGGAFRQLSEDQSRLRGGQGAALRPRTPRFVPARQGVRLGEGGRPGLRPDKHLPEISALLDPEQFRLISEDSDGLTIITGGAGSGKTTIALHRIAFLTFQHPKRYRPERMLVVVPGLALASYIGRVLPDLGIPGVKVRTLAGWLERLRRRMLPLVDSESDAEESDAVRRVKKHPAMLALLDRAVDEAFARVRETLAAGLADRPRGDLIQDALSRLAPGPLARRLRGLLEWCRQPLPGGAARLPPETLTAVEAILRRVTPGPDAVLREWSELLTDRERLAAGFAGAEGAPTPAELEETVRRTSAQAGLLLEALDARGQEAPDPESEDVPEAVDGQVDEVAAVFTPEDDALLLRLYQGLSGDLTTGGGQRLAYAHLMVDEVQDMSAVELAVLLGCRAPGGSVTLAGDPAQRLHFDTGYDDWPGLLRALGQGGVAVRPLRIGYRSTAEIQSFSRQVLGAGWQADTPTAVRHGAAVEMFRFGDPGEAVAFLADALRDLASEEPLASVALIARFPGQATLYFQGLERAQVASLRRVSEQDFAFTPGIEVTDVKQVKGLEFDYVVLLDVNSDVYPDTAEARHLLHIAATRAAHQLWVLVTGAPSPLLKPP